jgi:hypothetical protein
MSYVSKFRAKLETYAGGYEAASAYVFHRARAIWRKGGAPGDSRDVYGHSRPMPAADALALAKSDLLDGTRRYPAEAAWIGAPDKGVRAIGTPGDFGLRFIGFADELAGRAVKHTGWFTDEFQDSVMRGAVYALPARAGVTRLYAGYRTGSDRRAGWSDDSGEHVALIDFRQAFETEAREDCRDYCDATRSACYAADSMAERAAEREREYNEAWQCGSEAANLIESAKSDRAEARRLLGEIRGKAADDMPAVCQSIRAAIRGHLENAREGYAKARELWEEHADGTGWRERLADAFRDGAGAASFAELRK